MTTWLCPSRGATLLHLAHGPTFKPVVNLYRHHRGLYPLWLEWVLWQVIIWLGEWLQGSAIDHFYRNSFARLHWLHCQGSVEHTIIAHDNIIDGLQMGFNGLYIFEIRDPPYLHSFVDRSWVEEVIRGIDCKRWYGPQMVYLLDYEEIKGI